MVTSSNGNIFRVTGNWCGEFDVFFVLHPNKQLRKQSWGWGFETPSRLLWRYCNDLELLECLRWLLYPLFGCCFFSPLISCYKIPLKQTRIYHTTSRIYTDTQLFLVNTVFFVCWICTFISKLYKLLTEQYRIMWVISMWRYHNRTVIMHDKLWFYVSGAFLLVWINFNPSMDK